MVRRVLVLEDDDDLRDSITESLGLIGEIESVSAASLEAVERQAPEALETQVALLDINLGAGQPSGVDVGTWLRERGYRGRIVFVTGHASGHPTVDEARRAGAIVITKPVPFDELTRLIREGLG